MQIRTFHAADEGALIALWDECRLTRPWPELLLVGVADGAVMASAMAGYEGHRGWMNYLAVAPRFRGRGYAQDESISLGKRLIVDA